jgi:hypothetical protein
MKFSRVISYIEDGLEDPVKFLAGAGNSSLLQSVLTGPGALSASYPIGAVVPSRG